MLCFYDWHPITRRTPQAVRSLDSLLNNVRLDPPKGRKYLIHPSVGMRSPTEFERAPNGGAGEVAIYEEYLEAGFRGAIPSLIGKVSSFFGFSPSQLTPLTWRTLMALQMGSTIFDLVMAPLWSRKLRGVSEEIIPLGMVGTVDVSRPVSFAGEAVAKLVVGIPRRFRWVTFLVSREALRHSRVWGKPFRVWGNAVRYPVSVIYDEYQKVKTRKRRLFYMWEPKFSLSISI
ncbi:hypothetical protein F2Q69_00012703 [Brassica cretica]|uniref:Uncharacterized protein n=1 Tax=Brassica cretica TaxID=69181 RepID=A0A8S9R4P8_BRACR|nr:hypothetical protein F2Q69_00012703 [Brassica cretica]